MPVMSLGWRTALRSSGVWNRATSQRFRPRHFAKGGFTGTHIYLAPARKLTTSGNGDGPSTAGSHQSSLEIPNVRRNLKLGQYSGEDKLKFGQFFLRENCQCSHCIHPDTKQRIADTFAISPDVQAKSVNPQEQGLEIHWSDGHLGLYPYEWLRPHTQNMDQRGTRKSRSSLYSESDVGDIGPPRSFELSTSNPRVSYDDVMSDDAHLGRWLYLIWSQGFCFVDGVPKTPEATQGLIERIAFIRHTHYGGFWDFTADLTFKDTAYTNEFLGAHTDNTYFTDPARLQLFHLLSHTDGSGGENLLVDGFAAANQLREESQFHYEVLAKHRHPWHASGNEDVCIQPSFQQPAFSIHPDLNQMYQIRWNNYDRAPKVDWSEKEQSEWYTAARHYNQILKKMELWQRLEPSSALIFDNWRMLHGRSEFTGKRRMCGGYVNNDDFISRLRLLKYGREDVLNNLGNVRNDARNPYHII